MGDFRILSKEEEDRLSLLEKKDYYLQLRDYVRNRKIANTTKGITFLPKVSKKINKKLASLVEKFFYNGDNLNLFEKTGAGFSFKIRDFVNGLINDKFERNVTFEEELPPGPVVFFSTHEGVLDTFSWVDDINKDTVVLQSSKVKKLMILLQTSIGLILVNKENNESHHTAKYDMMSMISKGYSIMMFPESAWCLSPNKTFLPLKYGALDIARKMNVPIIPVVKEYDYNVSYNGIIGEKVWYGKPFYVKTEDDLFEKLTELEEIISTKKWEMWQENGEYQREYFETDDYIDYMKFVKGCLNFGGVSLDDERNNLFGAQQEKYVFQHINDIPYDDSGLLLPSEVLRLEKINEEHGIK